MKNKTVIGVFVVIAFVLLIGVSTLGKSTDQTSVKQRSLSGADGLTAKLIDDDYILGDPNAPVTIVEFADFQCQFCTRVFIETEPKIRQEYIETGKVRWVMRDYVATYHTKGDEAAIAAECAGVQGKYWEMHDKLFSNSYTGDTWNEMGDEDASTRFRIYARDIGLDMGRFNTCLDNRQFEDEINKDRADGFSQGVTGTPTFLIGNDDVGFTKVVGSQPFSVFKQVIDAKL